MIKCSKCDGDVFTCGCVPLTDPDAVMTMPVDTSLYSSPTQQMGPELTAKRIERRRAGFIAGIEARLGKEAAEEVLNEMGLRATLASWREKYELEEDGSRFVSVPMAVFDAVLGRR